MLGHHIHTRSHPVARQVADVVQLVGCEHVHYARQRADRRGVDFKYPRVGVGRTQHLDTQGPGGRNQVRYVTTAASQEAFVFETCYCTAYADVIGSRWTHDSIVHAARRSAAMQQLPWSFVSTVLVPFWLIL